MTDTRKAHVNQSSQLPAQLDLFDELDANTMNFQTCQEEVIAWEILRLLQELRCVNPENPLLLRLSQAMATRPRSQDHRPPKRPV